jgi:uncharacterized 2Fe-2S/4Fe-4S cluster protein (DUF4445 family)
MTAFRLSTVSSTVISTFLALLLCGHFQPILGEDVPQPQASKVVLVVDYGDGVQKRIAIEAKERMTVLDALTAAAEHPRGIKFKHRGSGETAFVTAIDDCENEGSGRNWTYRVGDKRATKSCGVQEISGGETITWSYLSSR